MKKTEVSKVMSYLGKKSAAKRSRDFYVELGKGNKGRKQSPAHVKNRISKALKTKKQKRVSTP